MRYVISSALWLCYTGLAIVWTSGLARLATAAQTLPAVAAGPDILAEQYDQPGPACRDVAVWTARAKEVHEAIQHSWRGYRKYAFGADTLRPVTNGSLNDLVGMAGTMVDALDTLLLAGEYDEYLYAEAWITSHLLVDQSEDVNLFETTIRVIGGLLSAYELTGVLMEQPAGRVLRQHSRRAGLLRVAADLADRLAVAWQHEGAPIPYSTVGLASGKASNPSWEPATSTSEVLTLQLEWYKLAELTGNATYAQLASASMAHVLAHPPKAGDWLLPMYIHPVTGQWRSTHITWGARVDSAYEYMLKQWMLAGGRHIPAHTTDTPGGEHDIATPAHWHALRDAYDTAVAAALDDLARDWQPVDEPEPAVLLAEKRTTGKLEYKMDHLVCFAGGMFALGAVTAPDTVAPDTQAAIWRAARGVTRTCAAMYNLTESRLAPEIVRWDTMPEREEAGAAADAAAVSGPARADAGMRMKVDPGAKHNLLRPETLESMFILYRLTGECEWAERAWAIFQAFNTTSRTAAGFSNVRDVTASPVELADKMETFWLAESLKYLYLTFAPPSRLSLKHWVFNTEAHPLRLWGT